MTDLAKLVVRLEAEISEWVKGMDGATKAFEKFGDKTKDLALDLAGALGLLFTVDKAVEWGKAIVENADALGKLSQSTGETVENLSRLQFGLVSSGVPAEALGGIFRNLNKAISEAAGDATSEAATAFRLLGINAKDAAGNTITLGAAANAIADKFSKTADGANKSAISVALLGKEGATAIPFFNQGADGIARFNKEADELGVTLDGSTSKAAEEFNDKLGKLKAGLTEGIGNRVAAEVLPILNRLGDSFGTTAEKAAAFDHAAEVITFGLKGLITFADNVVTQFDKLGTAIGATAAAAVTLFTDGLQAAAKVYAEGRADVQAKEAAFQKRYAAIWAEGGREVVKTAEATSTGVKNALANLAEQRALEEAARKAVEKLKNLNEQISGQVATFGLGDAALIKYRLTLGDLSKDVKDAGPAGDRLAASIERQAAALQKLKDSKEIREALAGVTADIEKLRGDSADAVVAEFDKKYADLITKLRQAGNVEGERQLELLLKLQVAQADINELNKKAAEIQADLATTEERLRNSRDAGALTELDMQQQLSEARRKAADDLAKIAEAEDKIAKTTGNQEQIDGVKRLKNATAELRSQTDLLAQSVRANIETSFSDALVSVAKDFHNAGDAVASFFQSIADQLLKLAANQLAQQIFGALLGSGTAGGGFLSSLLGSFGGGKAAGGDVQPGMMYKINENTPHSEYFVPSQPGSIVPAAAMMGKQLQVTQQFILQAPNGTVSRQTQLQVGLEASRGLQAAQRRNG